MKTQQNIREHMEVIGSCGNCVGVVDHVDEEFIALKPFTTGDGQQHFIPLGCDLSGARETPSFRSLSNARSAPGPAEGGL